MVGHRGQFVGERVDDPVELGVHRGGVGLVIDRVQQRLSPSPKKAFGQTVIRLAA